MKKQLLSILTCLALCLSLLPAAALAAEDTTPATPTVSNMNIFANGTPITIEEGESEGTSKVWYGDPDHKTYLDLNPSTDEVETELDISAYNIYGGTNSSDFEGNTKITMTGGKVNGIISGSYGEMTGSTSITMTGGEVTGVIYGAYTKINGSVTIDLHSGTVRTIYGVNVDSSDCDVLVNVCGGTITGFNTGQSVVSIYILGQCNSHTVDISGGIVTGDVYGGLSKTSGNCKSAAVNISGGTVNGNIYGGGKAYVLGDAAVTVSGGTVNGNIDVSSNVKGSGTITVSGGTVKGSIDATPTQDGSSGTITLKDEAHVQIPADGTLKAKNSITLGSGYARTAAGGDFSSVEDNATRTSPISGYYEYVGANHNKNIQIDENDHGHVCTSENCAIGGVSIATGQHDDWKYSVSDLTITKTCGTCGHEAASATLSGPDADAPTYDGTAKEATMTQEGSWGDSEITLTYAGTGISDSAAAPTAAGSYTATMTAGGKSVSVNFTIAPATPTITWADASASVEYTGTAASITAPTVTLKNGETYNGTINYSYTGTSSGSGLPTDAGTYTITARIDEQGNYTGATSTNTLALTISPKPVTVTPTSGQSKTYGAVDPAFTYNVSPALATGDSLTGALSRAEGEALGEYDFGIGTLSGDNNYNLTLATGDAVPKFTIEKATVDLSVDLSPSSQKINKDVTITVTAKNAGADLLASGWAQPNGVTVAVGSADVTMTQTDAAGGVWTGTYHIADDTTLVNQTFIVTASVNDTSSNYTNPTNKTAALTVTEKGPVTVAVTASKTTGITYGDSVTYTANVAKFNSDDTDPLNGTVTFYLGDPENGGVEIGSSDKMTGATVTLDHTKLTAGSHTVYAVYSGNDYFATGSGNTGTTVDKATITITAKNQSIYVGGTAPDLSSPALNTHYTVTGLVGGDTLDGTITMEYQKDGAAATPDTSKTGSYDIVISGATVPAGGNYNEQITFTPGTMTISTRPSSGGGGGGYTPPVQNVTVPISGDDNTIHVGASVSGDKATVKNVDLDHLDTVIGDHVDTGTVTIDFSGLNSSKPITTVELPSNVVKQIAEAVNDPGNDAQSLEVVLSNGLSIEFDAVALGEKAAQADGQDITISIQNSKDAKPNQKQEAALKGRPAYDITVTSGGEHISDMGGKITVHAPYELQDGEHPRGIVVWYVDEDGKRERCETSYDPVKKRVNWKTDHLSLYMIDYDERFINPFTDISEDKYYYDAVLWAVDSGITNGTSATTFSPDVSCTRAQMATFLWRAAGSPNPAGSTNPFTDVSADAYYAKAVQWAYEQGITGGTSATTFSPDAPCTRGQMATFLWRNAGSPATTGSANPFTDVSDDAYYAKAVQWAYEQEITGGTSATTFSPDADCTRAQMVTFLYRNFEE